MQEEFIRHRVDARKTLIDFIREHTRIDVLKELPKDTRGWIDELSLIDQHLTGQGLVGATGIFMPPIGDPDFKKLGEKVFISNVKNPQLKGLWVHKPVKKVKGMQISEAHNWTQYKLGSRATLNINPAFSEVPIDKFLPENFEESGTKVDKNKRPIFTFEVSINGNPVKVYAKGSYVTCGIYYGYSQPKYRLSPISSISKVTSQTEMQITLELKKLGVKVPKIVGDYKADAEEFLFLQEVKGKPHLEFIDTHRDEIIEQDAKMLAALCLAGYRKVGFTDSDDKLFDGTHLHLIDVEECKDLYWILEPEYRKMLLNPSNETGLREFRMKQIGMFEQMLQDALYNYRSTLTPDQKHKVAYIDSFFRRLGWTVTGEKITELTTFSKKYQTFDSWMSAMSESD